jgi:sugar phosphate permease
VSADWPSAAVVAGACVFYMFLIPVWGVLFVLTPEAYPVKHRGTAVGFHHMCKSLPSLVAPFIAAAILDSGLEASFMFIWAGVIAVGVAMSYWLLRLSRRDEQICKAKGITV